MLLDGRHLRYLVKSQPSAVVGLVIVAVAIVLAMIGPAIAPFDPRTAIPGDQLQPPSFASARAMSAGSCGSARVERMRPVRVSITLRAAVFSASSSRRAGSKARVPLRDCGPGKRMILRLLPV